MSSPTSTSDHPVTAGAALTFAPTDNAVDSVIERARTAADAGIRSIWLGQRFNYDAIALAGLIGREVPEISVGTSAVPIFGRHPLLVAGQAQTTQAATHGRFHLGLALGSARLTEQPFGIPFARPARRLEEFLTVTRELLETGSAEFHGEIIDTTSPLPVSLPGADPVPPIVVAALGPRALAISGRLADGILPFLATPKVLEQHIIPILSAAAAEAGRPSPRVIALVPALVTDDIDSAENALAESTALYDSIDSYRRVIALAGLTRAVEVGLIGSAEQVRAGLQDYLNAGAAEVVVTQNDLLGPEVARATWEVAASVQA